jgi:cystathionine gamma-synthase
LAKNLAHYRQIATERGVWLTFNATFAPPPLQNPFVQGADVILHSGTKFIGSHSDMLCGVLSIRPDLEAEKGLMQQLHQERQYLGSVMGSLEGWLGVRSIRTLEIRVERQAKSAQELVNWIESERRIPGSAVGNYVAQVLHASRQPEAQDASSWLNAQTPKGFGPIFAIMMKDEMLARSLTIRLHLFYHATSFGEVESLVEWRTMVDKRADRRVVRLSIGVEAWEDLKADLLQAFKAFYAKE